MTDPDTIAAFNAIKREIDSAQPTPLEDAVLRHIEQAPALPPIPSDLSLPPTDADIFDGVPKALPEEITEKIGRTNLADDDWDDDKTAVNPVPNLRPYDPTHCMM